MDQKPIIEILKSYYPDIFPYNIFPPEDSVKVKELIKKSLSGKHYRGNFCFISKLDICKPVFVYCLLAWGKESFASFKMLTLPMLLDIAFNKCEEIRSISDLHQDVIGIVIGYGESKNKFYADVLIQLIEHRKLLNKFTWLFFRGSQDSFITNFPAIWNYLKNDKSYFLKFIDNDKISSYNNNVFEGNKIKETVVQINKSDKELPPVTEVPKKEEKKIIKKDSDNYKESDFPKENNDVKEKNRKEYPKKSYSNNKFNKYKKDNLSSEKTAENKYGGIDPNKIDNKGLF